MSFVPNGGVSDATTSTKGVVQLGGDLDGTAAAPTVPALADKANDTAVVKLSGSQTIAGTKTFSSSIVAPNVGNKVSTGTTAPTGPSVGDVWIDTN